MTRGQYRTHPDSHRATAKRGTCRHINFRNSYSRNGFGGGTTAQVRRWDSGTQRIQQHWAQAPRDGNTKSICLPVLHLQH